jgi:hypothetical protein
MDSDITHTDSAGIAKVLGYDNYGYDLQGKLEKKNLFAYISLYLIQNASATRIDLINPYMQSMQHDQFSQDQSSELAQNTVTWGYENVVYYNQRPINAGIDALKQAGDQELLGILKGDQTIFNWQDNSYWMTQDSAFGAQFEPPKSKVNPRQSLSQQMASSRGGPGSSNDVAWSMANSFAELQQVTENARMRKRDKFSSTEADTNWLKDSQGITKSNINREFSEELTHLASNTTDFHGLTVQSGKAIKAIEVATEVDSFAAIPTDGNALDTTETNSKKTGSAQGSNNIPTTKQGVDADGIPLSLSNKGIAIQTGGAQSPNIFTRAIAEYNAMSPAEKAVVHKNAALRREKAQNDRR